MVVGGWVVSEDCRDRSTSLTLSIFSPVLGFTRPQFICPIRTLRDRGRNYTTADSDTAFCPTNYDSNISGFTSAPVFAPNNQWELDPDNNNCIEADKRVPFATCKNTCPGGERIFNFNIN